MNKPIFSGPEEFGLSPLLSMLPVRGKVKRLEGLTASLYARHEKVVALKKALADTEDAVESQRRVSAEERMLRQVLDWLEVTVNSDVGEES